MAFEIKAIVLTLFFATLVKGSALNPENVFPMQESEQGVMGLRNERSLLDSNAVSSFGSGLSDFLKRSTGEFERLLKRDTCSTCNRSRRMCGCAALIAAPVLAAAPLVLPVLPPLLSSLVKVPQALLKGLAKPFLGSKSESDSGLASSLMSTLNPLSSSNGKSSWGFSKDSR